VTTAVYLIDGGRAEAPIESAMGLALSQGAGALETLRVRNGRPVDLESHLARLLNSCRLAMIPVADASSIAETAISLAGELVAPGHTRWQLRILATGSPEGRSHCLIEARPAIVTRQPARLALSRWTVDETSSLTGAKLTNFGPRRRELLLARQAGFDEILVADRQGRLSETAFANVFLMIGGRWFTPALTTGCLPGITRAQLISPLAACEIEIGLASLTRLARTVEAAFLSSSVQGLRPVAQLGDLVLNAAHPAVNEAMEVFEAVGAVPETSSPWPDDIPVRGG
jgi:branched-subunit amino acid aminotransferase/4-amino-4-deoxychorismate lyase